jgi:hypothetical protein
VPFGCSLGRELQKIQYGGRWWLPLSPSRGESSESSCPWLVPTPRVSRMWINVFVVGFWMQIRVRR